MNGFGKLVVIVLDCNQDKVFVEGILIILDNQIDIIIGMVKFKVCFENVDGKLFFNQFVNVCLLVQIFKGVLIILVNVVQCGINGIYVYVVGVDNKVSQCSVVIGISENEWVVVESGLKVGEQVVVEGIDCLCDGMEVCVVEVFLQVFEGELQKLQIGCFSGFQGDLVGSGSVE